MDEKKKKGKNFYIYIYINKKRQFLDEQCYQQCKKLQNCRAIEIVLDNFVFSSDFLGLGFFFSFFFSMAILKYLQTF